MRGAMQAWLTAITRCHSVCSDRRAVSASSESHRALSRQSTLRFRDLSTAEVAQHRLSFRLSFRPYRTTVNPSSARCKSATPASVVAVDTSLSDRNVFISFNCSSPRSVTLQ